VVIEVVPAVRAAQVSLGWLQGYLNEALQTSPTAALALLRDPAVVARSNQDMHLLVCAGYLLPLWIYRSEELLKRYGWRIPVPGAVETTDD